MCLAEVGTVHCLPLKPFKSFTYRRTAGFYWQDHGPVRQRGLNLY